MYKTLTVLRKPFNGRDMKHPINGKVHLYFVCSNIEFKKEKSFYQEIKTFLFVSAQRHDLSSYSRLWRLNREKNGLRRLEKYVL